MSGVNWASGGPPKPRDDAPIPTARSVEGATEVTGESADAALAPPERAKVVTQERLRLFLESKEYADREKKEIQADLDAGASVEAGAVHAKINSGSDHTYDFRAELVAAVDMLIKAGIVTGFQSGEDYVQDGVGKAKRKSWKRLEVKR